MSRKNNVNPDHYKVAGRDRPNEVVPPEHTKRDPETKNKRGAKPNFIPGAATGRGIAREQEGRGDAKEEAS